MLEFYSQIIKGTLKPHLISNPEIVQNFFFKRLHKPEFKEDLKTVIKENYGSINITKDENSKNIYIELIKDDKLEELVDMRLPNPPDEKAKTYLTLIFLEFELIKIAVNRFIDNENRIENIELFNKKTLNKLKGLSKQLSEYIKRLKGEHNKLYTEDANHFITHALKHYLIDTIQYIQESSSDFIEVKYQTQDELLEVLFGEEFSNFPLFVLSLLPEELDDFKNDFIKRNKEYLSKNLADKKGLSIGKELFYHYKALYENLSREEKLGEYNRAIHFWNKLLLSGELDQLRYGKYRKDPEIKQVLIPMIEDEVELLKSLPETEIKCDIPREEKQPTVMEIKPPEEPKDSIYTKTYLDIGELSTFINKSRSTIYKYTSAGKIPSIKQGKTLLFKREDIEKWLEEEKSLNIEDYF